MQTLILATRPSALARWQTNYVAQELESAQGRLTCEQIVITTKGDHLLDKPLPEIGGKGLFTTELETALHSGSVHAAVHSLKDLPTEDVPGLVLGAIPERAEAGDVLVCPAGHTLEELPRGSVVGTSSIRRRAQILAHRSDLEVKSIRGNVDTRLRKVQDGQYDAIILAAAGITRLGMQAHITQHLPYDIMLPAPGQGALAVQCRADDEETLRLLTVLNHTTTNLAVTAERTFLAELGGGCSLPVGAFATVEGSEISMQVVVAALDGSAVIRVSGTHTDAQKLGQELAEQVLAQGGKGLLP